MFNSTIDEKQLLEEKALIKRWRPLLEAKNQEVPKLADKKSIALTARLLQNQLNHMKTKPHVYGDVSVVEESITAGGQNGVFNQYGSNDPAFADGSAGERPNNGAFGGASPTNNDFYARGDARVPSVIMPMVRRVYPELLANKIVGIQPMNGPVGLAFALRKKYDGENLACMTPDGGCTVNPPASASHPHRSFGQEAGYNFLNSAHTGTTSDALTGNESFQFVAEDQGVADLLSNLECNTAIPQMGLCIEKQAVEAGSRKLAVKFSQESEEDLQAMYGLSIRDEMISTMSEEVQAEIDREILMRMLQISLKAGEGRGWSVWNPAEADGRWSQERALSLYQHIVFQARLVQIKTRRGPANFAVATPAALTILEALGSYWKPNCCTTDTAGVKEVAGQVEAGSISGIKVYADTRTEAQYQTGVRDARVDYIMLGYKGRESHDTGLVYLPYIPIMLAETRGTHDGDPRLLLRTRYALATNLFGAENFYHTIILKGLSECIDSEACKKFFW